MKRLLIGFGILLMTVTVHAQSNKEIAGVYIKKAEKSLNDLEVEESLRSFNKAVKLLDSIESHKVARLGTLINYELNKYREAKTYAKQYFTLAKKRKNTEEYQELLELYVSIEEEIEKIEAEEKRLEEERIRKEKELRRIDSLKVVWTTRSNGLSLQVDSIYTFDKNGIALFTKDGNYGLLNDKGEVIAEANEYKQAKAFDAYVLLIDNPNAPTKIYSYNTTTKTGFVLPSVSEFNPISTTYGTVTLPRGSGRVVIYPNNSLQAMVYDLNEKKYVRIANQKALFKTLRKADKIDKSNKDGEVKVNREWYNFGGHIGGGIHPLYNKDYSIHGYLCAVDGKVLKTNEYSFLGAFHGNKSQVITNGKTFWVNQNGTKADAPKNTAGTYTGASKVIRLDNGAYQIHQKVKGKNTIVLGNEKLVNLKDFLRAHKKEE